MGSTSVYATSSNGHYVYASITWDDSLLVTVNITDVNAGWCIKIRGTQTKMCEGSSSNRIDTFYAEEGQDYVLQVYDTVEGSYANNGNPVFTVTIDTGDDNGGSNGGDDSDDSDNSSANNDLKEYAFTAQGVTAKATYTSGPEVTITILSWNGYNSIPYWRIRGVESEGDRNIYLTPNNKQSNTFDSIDMGYGDGYDSGGKNYIFQISKNNIWGNDGGDASKFHVDFSLSGDGGGDATDSYTMHFNEGEGTNLTVTRTSSTYGTTGIIYENGNIYYDDIWANDCFEIVVEAQEGYQLNELAVDGLQYADGVYTFNGGGNASITISATLITSARIFNKNTSSWNTYGIYIYDGSSWNRYRPYIYKGSSWNLYS